MTIGKTNQNARPLRRNATDAEQRLWHHLCNRQLFGLKFRRQVTIGPFIADFACIERKLIIKADSGQHNEQADLARTVHLEQLGWRVLRFWNNDILENTSGVLESILEKASSSEEGRPSPCPLPLAGEGN